MVRMAGQSGNVFSLSHAIDIRNRGAAIVADAAVIAAAIQNLDAALQTFCEDRSTDEMQAVITTARKLSELLDGDRPATRFESDNRDIFAEARRARGMQSMPEFASLSQLMGDVA